MFAPAALILIAAASMPALGAVVFEPNQGQTGPGVQFLARTPAGVVFATHGQEIILHREQSQPVRFSFGNANPKSVWQGLDPTGHKTHYLLGRDPRGHIRGLDSFRKLTRKNLYPGIDLVLYGNSRNELEYDLVLAPGADPGQIQVKAADARIDRATGDLIAANGVRQRKPLILQGNRTIPGRFKQIASHTFGFEIASYDKNEPLVIDPVIESRDYIGGIGEDTISSVGPRNSVAGTTTSIDFPGAPLSIRHGKDVFYRRDGVTFIMGGSGDETIAANCDIADFIYSPVIAGTTNSTDLPTRVQTYNGGHAQLEFGGGATDGFLWSPYGGVTYLGGSGEDRLQAITTASGSFAITGSTNSGADFPIAASNLRQSATPGGGFDAFLILGGVSGLVNLEGSASAWQISMVKMFGGSGDDQGFAILTDGSTGVHMVAGETASPDFPVLNGFQGTRKGATDGFLTRFLGSTITASTLLGGNGSDRINAIAWPANKGRVSVAGDTSSGDFPLQQPSQASYGGGALDAFQATFAADLVQLKSSTYFGGSGTDEARAIALDTIGLISIGGRTTSTNLLQRNPVQNGHAGGGSDGFFAQWDGSTGVLRQATYLGGSGADEILALGDVQPGYVSAAGVTTSIDLPGSGIGILEPRRFGTAEGFVARLSTGTIALPTAVTSARESRLAVPMGLIDLSNVKSGRAALQSSDSSKVRATFRRNGAAYGIDSYQWQASDGFALPLELYVECVGDDGEATLTVTSPGLTDATMLVRCAQPQLRPNILTFPVSLLTTDYRTSVLVEAVDPVTSEVFRLTDAVRPDGSIRRVTIESSNPQVAVPGNTETKLPDPVTGAGGPFLVLPVSAGTATFIATAPGYRSVPSAVLTVVPASGSPQTIRLGPGFSYLDRAIATSLPLFPATTTVIRSLDPSRVLVSDGLSAPQARITVTGNGSYSIVTLPSAAVGMDIGIEMSTNGAPATVARIVRMVEPMLQVVESLTTVQLLLPPVVNLSLGETRTFQLRPAPDSGNPKPTFESSNPAVVPTPASGYTLTLTGLAEGTSVITIRPPSGFQLFTPQPVTVRVTRAAFAMPNFSLGNGLVATQTITLPLPSNENVTISTSTPDLIQLERTTVSGLASSIVEPANGKRTVAFRVHGKASLGQGRITVSIPGYAPVTTVVRLYPPGFFWTAETLSLPAGQTSQSLAVGPVDPVIGLPLESQALSGNGPSPRVDSSNPPVAVFAAPASVSALAGGQANLTIFQPAGFGTAVIRQVLRVAVPAPPQSPTQGLLRMNIAGGSGFIGGTYTCSASPCFANPNVGAAIQLVATPSAGFVFARWNGACSGAGPCSIAADASSKDVTAIFAVDTGLHFLPVAPCRIVDTRNPNGPLGGPALQGTRNFPVRSSCGMPASAVAYSLNITVVPRITLGYITLWPGGLTQPTVSTLNSLDGRIKANAAIVPAGEADGSINLFATDLTDIIVDVNGVFVPKTATAVGQSFYAVTPCRVADTRLRGGAMQAQVTQGFAVAGVGGCGVPVSATAFALNVTVVPKTTLGFLTLWPGGVTSVRPTVSTLNAVTGTVTANMAIVPAGSAGDINAYATDATDLILDVTGYFAPPGQANALSFRTLPPCRIADTRLPGSSILNAVSTRDFSVPCGAPASANAYSVNSTVLPSSILGFLTLYPTGATRPLASTLNAVDGALTSNAAIVPAGLNGAISAFVTERTHLILDINGYFAP